MIQVILFFGTFSTFTPLALRGCWELQKQIDDLLLLLDAFHDGVVAEDHKSK